MTTSRTCLSSSRMHDTGSALLTVLGLVFLTGAFAAIVCHAVATSQIIARRQVSMEKAMYVAEAGAEKMVAFISTGGSGPLVTNLSCGSGSALVSINVESGASYGAGTHVFGGRIKLNSSNNASGAFAMTLPDASMITKAQLTPDFSGYTGDAVQVHLDLAGSGAQNWFLVDGTNRILSNANTYDLLAADMHVAVTNDSINLAGKAVGQWWIGISASGGTLTSTGADGDDVSLASKFNIVSYGTVNGVTRGVNIKGLRLETWAKYALWANDNNNIYFKDGEIFWGAVHSNSRLYFSHTAGNTNPPTFYGKVTSTDTQVGPAMSSTNGCLFYEGLKLGAPTGTLAAVDFTNLLGKATLVLTGRSYIAMSGTNVLITNSRRGWSNSVVGVTPLIYVKTATTGTNSPMEGDVDVKGTLDGRMTVVAERDINITGNTTYASDPKTNSASNDALGLISKRDVVVKSVCPTNLQLYAHVLATGVLTPSIDTDGSFYVENYDTRSPSGNLTMHGGIGQHNRGAVGTFNTGTGTLVSGFNKNYTYDSRFMLAPPPFYPPLADAYVWDRWKEYGWNEGH